MTDAPKLTPADIEAILDAARHHADILDSLEQAYYECDFNKILVLLRELLNVRETIH